MDSLQCSVPGFHPRRSPRIIDQQQRDVLLGFQQRRVHYTVIRDSMTEVEKEALREKWRNAYHRRKTRNECGNTADSRNNSLTPPLFDHKTMEREP
ncbi:hypothetical protein MKW98_025796, partial [Papaver atlanticum]